MTREMFKMALALALLITSLASLRAQGGGGASVLRTPVPTVMPQIPNEGPDVVLGILDNLGQFRRADGMVFLAATTVSCNIGNRTLGWHRLPQNNHPVITQNLYRLLNGRMQQIGQSWVKHGFLAAEGDLCRLPFPCQATQGDQQLGVGCSDPYGASINFGPELGARSKINPTTGYFNGSDIKPSGLERGLDVKEADISVSGARYFLEGQYITPDDSAGNNGLNNTSYREVTPRRLQSGDWIFENRGETIRMKSAVEAWEGATVHALTETEAIMNGKEIKSRILVISRVINVAGNRNRYEYTVYNMNSDRGVRAFEVRVGNAPISNIGFSAVESYNEGFSNDAWTSSAVNGAVIWSTKTYAEDVNANAIRWGTSYNFWFESEGTPADVEANLGRFKPGERPDLRATVKGPQ